MKQVKKRGVRLPKINANTMQLLCICLVIFAVFSFLKPSRFPMQRNLESMCFQMPEPGLFTLRIAITMLTAGADLSIVAVANLVATLCGLMLLNVMLTGQHPSRRLAEGHAGRIIRRCTMMNPDQRFRDVLGLRDAL